MSSDATGTIIEGLKQGNTIELELVKKFKEGLIIVADGMRDECLNRSEALEELRETLEAKASEESNAIKYRALRKTAQVLKNFMLLCKHGISSSEIDFTNNNIQVNKDYEREMQDINTALQEKKDNQKRIDKMLKLVCHLCDEKCSVTSSALHDLCIEGLDSNNGLQKALKKKRAECKERLEARKTEIEDQYNYAKESYEWGIKCAKNFAIRGGITLSDD